MQRSDVAFLVVVAAIVGSIFGMAWVDFGHQARWLYDYQTLVAGILAVVAAGITLRALHEQIAEQRKQTAFALGEALPTMSAAHPKGRSEDVVLRIVNWNRVPADILEVRVVESTKPIQVALRDIHLRDDIVPVNMDPKIDRIVRIHGWENRSEPPGFAEVFAYVTIKKENTGPNETIRTTFAVDLLLFADVPRTITLTAQINMLASRL